MIDLSSTLFFKGTFSVQALKDDTDLLWDLVLKIRRWMTSKWRRQNETIPQRMPL